MNDKKEARRSGNCARAKTPTSRDVYMIPDWAAIALGVMLGWPFLAWAVI